MTIVAFPMILMSVVAMVIALANDRRRARIARVTGTNQWSDNEASPLDAT